MDISFDTMFCEDKCSGVDNCRRYCTLHTGKAIYDFIKGVNLSKTRIGEFDRSERDGKLDLVVFGHQVWDGSYPSSLLTYIGVTLDANPKFSDIDGKNSAQILSNYCNKANIDKEDKEDVLDKLNKLNNNKMIVVPFKTGTKFSVETEDSNACVDAKLLYLKWQTSKETFRLECTAAFEYKERCEARKVYKWPITEYLEKFRISNLEMQNKSKKSDSKIIKITDYGIVKPIVITDDNTSLAIDGSYMYLENKGSTTIVGRWVNDNIVTELDKKNKHYKFILNNLDVIKKHRSLIAPYMLYESNTIKIKGDK